MATDVGQLPPQPDDVEQINDEEVLRRMWQAAEDFGRKKEIRARMYKLREKRLREFYTTGEVLKDVQSADPHAAIREETPKRGGTTYRELVVGELRAGDHFDIREKPAEQTKPAELIESSDGSHQQLQQQAVTVIFESTTTTTTTTQEMLDSRSEAESPPASRTSSRRSSKSSPSRDSGSRRSSTTEVKLTSSPTREVKVTTSSYEFSRVSGSPSGEVEVISTRTSGVRSPSVEVKMASSATREVKVTSSSYETSSRVSSSPAREVKSVSSRRSSDAKSPEAVRSPSRGSGSRSSSVSEVKLASSATKEVKATSSSFETTSRASTSPVREVKSSASRRTSDAKSPETVRSPSSRRSSTTDEVKSRSTPQRELIESQELKSNLRRSSETRKSSSPAREMSKSPSPTRQVSSRKSSVSEKKEDAQFSTFTSVTLVRQQEGGSRVTSPNRRKLSSAGSKARRAGTPSASPPCSPTHEEERHDESSDDEVATVRSKVEDAAKPKSILRTPEQRKKSITDEVKKPEPKKAEPQQVKRVVAEVKLTRKAVPEKKPVSEAKKTLRRRSREQVEDSSDRDSSCSPVRTRTLSKSKVSPKQEAAPATPTLKRPTKLPMLNNTAAKKQPEPAAGKHEDRCCGRRHGATSPDKPWRQSPVQSPKKTSPTGKKANRSPSSSPERPAPVETRPAKRTVPTLASPTTKKTVESTVRKTITDRSSTSSCVKTPERPVTSRLTVRSATTPIKTEANRFQRKAAEPAKTAAASPAPSTVRKAAIPTYQRTQASRTTAARTTTSSIRQPLQQKTSTLRTNGRSLSGSKIVEKAQKEAPKVAQSPKEPAPAVTISKPVESEEESAGFSTEEDETVTELEDIRYSSANLLDTEDEESSSRRLLTQGQTQIQQLSRDSSPDGRPQRFADRVSEPESDFESTKRERTPLEVVVPPGGLDGLQEEEDEEEEKDEPALLSVADKANIFLTTDLGKVEKKQQVFETNKAVSLAKAVFERTEDEQEEARKKYERDILSRPSVFSKVTDRIRNFDQPAPAPVPVEEAPKEKEQPARRESDVKEPVVEQPIKAEKVAPLCEEQPKASVTRASGKFGVTLRRTGSRVGDSVAAPQEAAQEEAKPAVQPAEKQAEETVDVRQLEIMLEKATNYDERRRLRAAIRDAKKTQTIFTTTSTTKVSTTRRASPTRQVNGRRSVSPVKSESGRKNSSPSRKQAEEVDGNSVSTPLRAAEETAKPELVKQPSTGKLDKGKFANFQKEDSSTNSSVVTIKRKVSQETESVRKISGPPREANPTDSVTSSYGVGPLDESGRPLFGLRALRRTQEPAAAAAPTEVVDQPTPPKQEVTDLSGRPLFGGLRALKKEAVASVVQEKEPATEEDAMPELQPATGQLKSLVERHEQNSKACSTTVSPSSAQKPKAKLRDTFVREESRSKIAADAQKASKTEALINRGERQSSLKAIIKKHETSQEATNAPVEPVRKISTEQVKSILKKPRESTPETTVVSSASISLRKDSIDRRPGDIEQESIVEDEDGGRTVVKSVHRERNDGDTSTVHSATARSHVSGDGSYSTSQMSSTTMTSTSRGTDSPISMGRVGRSGSVRALQQKFQQNNTDQSPEPRSFPKAGLIFRTNSFKHANNGDFRNSGADSKDVCEESARRTEQVTEKEGSVERRVTETRVFSESSTSSNSRSFLGNNTKVTGVQDVLSRMREADNNQDEGLSCEDREAKSLLNKFLGASVLMQGIEPILQAQSSALVSQVEKQRLAVAQEEKKPSGDDIDEVTDQAHLRRLLDAASDYDTRRQIRARLRTLMADNKVTDSSDGAADSASRSVHEKSEFSMKTSSSTSTIQLDGGTKISSVSSTMTSNTRVSKAPPSKLKMSPFDKFRQLDEQNSSPSPSTPKTPGGSISGPLFKFTDAGLNRSASNVKERLLYWCQVKTKEYKDLKIENFSTSWNNGMAFCALIHHFCPDAFNYEDLRPENRRKNFELAFRVAEEKADIAPLLDVDDMVMMKKPDWKCVFTYVQSIYRRFKDED